jgi:hypothetical protein
MESGASAGICHCGRVPGVLKKLLEIVSIIRLCTFAVAHSNLVDDRCFDDSHRPHKVIREGTRKATMAELINQAEPL